MALNDAIRKCPDCGSAMNPCPPSDPKPKKWVCHCGKLVKA